MPKKIQAAPSRHVEMVRNRLVTYRGKYEEIARCTGIPSSWVRQFAQGLYCDPGSARLETLARVIGFQVVYARIRPAFRPEQRRIDEEAIRENINAAVYGDRAN